MYSKISKTVIALFSLLLAVSFSAEAGFKSGYKSSYRSSYKSSYKPSSASKSYSSSSSSSSSSSRLSTKTASKPLSTSQKTVIAGSGAALTVGTASASESKSASAAPVASKSDRGVKADVATKKSVSGAKLVEKRGKIYIPDKTSAEVSAVAPSRRISGTSSRDYTSMRQSAPENVRTIIRERERSGTDWTSLALMYWMMSSSNSHASSLSASDKTWIQQQIKEQENNGVSREAALGELNEAGVDLSTLPEPDNTDSKTAVQFTYDLPKAFTAGKLWMFVVSATRDGKKQAPDCELEGATFMKKSNNLLVRWKAPAAVGQKTDMKCKAFGAEEIKSLLSA